MQTERIDALTKPKNSHSACQPWACISSCKSVTLSFFSRSPHEIYVAYESDCEDLSHMNAFGSRVCSFTFICFPAHSKSVDVNVGWVFGRTAAPVELPWVGKHITFLAGTLADFQRNNSGVIMRDRGNRIRSLLVCHLRRNSSLMEERPLK